MAKDGTVNKACSSSNLLSRLQTGVSEVLESVFYIIKM